MTPRTILAITAAACLGAWLVLRTPAADPVSGVAPAPAAAPKTAAPGQGGWFASTPHSSASLADPRVRPGSADAAIYGRNGRVVDLGGKTVADYIAARMGKARAGDVAAAYEAYQAASVCAANEDPVTDFGDPAEREQFMRERQGLAALCAGMTPAQVQERLGFLATAARAGKVDAQIDFYMEGPYGRHFDMADNPDDPIVKQWKQDALGHLQQAGNKCDHFALALLSTVYDAGQLTQRDLKMSMAYSIAAAAPRKQQLTEQQLRERFGEELSPADFAGAMQMGAQLSAQACPP